MTSNPKICIVDYGVGNLFSVIKAFKQFNVNIVVSEEVNDIIKSDALILPGVGSFGSGMDGLRIRGLESSIKRFVQSGKSVLGICLGAQILFSRGHEFDIFAGLNIIEGEVVKFPNLNPRVKIPHIGWNQIYPSTDGWPGTILSDLTNKSYVYFAHSFVMKPKNNKNVLALCNYSNYEFCAAIKKENVTGCQFHPEKSGKIGLDIIRKFIETI